MNDGSTWVKTSDLEASDREMLVKLHEAVAALLAEDEHNSIERFTTGDGTWHWYPGCHCQQCDSLCERIDDAQAELEVGLKSAAITSEIADSGHTAGWRRVAAWLAKETGDAERSKAVRKAAEGDRLALDQAKRAKRGGRLQ